MSIDHPRPSDGLRSRWPSRATGCLVVADSRRAVGGGDTRSLGGGDTRSLGASRRVGALALALAFHCFAGIFPLGCGGKPDRVVIGVAVSREDRWGVELAVQEINEEGGIGGVPVEVYGSEWDFEVRADPRDVLLWGERFAATEELVAVVGQSDSSSTLSAAAYYNEMGLPQLVTIATHPAITSVGEWTYRLCVSDALQGPALARYVFEEWGKSRVAVIHVSNIYGFALLEAFSRELERLGGEVVSRIWHRQVLELEDQKILRSQLRDVGQQGPDLILLVHSAQTAAWFVPELRRAGIRADILGADNVAQPQFLEGDVSLKEGVRVSQFFVPRREYQRSQEFSRSYRRFTGKEPDYGAAFAYDAVYLIRQAILAEGYSRSAVKRYLDRAIRRATRLEGVAGRFRLAEDHDARRPFYIVEVRDGEFHPVAQVSTEFVPPPQRAALATSDP